MTVELFYENYRLEYMYSEMEKYYVMSGIWHPLSSLALASSHSSGKLHLSFSANILNFQERPYQLATAQRCT